MTQKRVVMGNGVVGMRTVEPCAGATNCLLGTHLAASAAGMVGLMLTDYGVVTVDRGCSLPKDDTGVLPDHPRACDFLVPAADLDTAQEYAGAYMQLYREGARPGEHATHWLDRMGLGQVRARLLGDPEDRSALYTRYLFSQSRGLVGPSGDAFH